MNADIHPRVSVNAMSTFSWTQQQDLEFYKVMGIRKAGLSMQKLEQDPASITAIHDSGLRVSTVLVGPSCRGHLDFVTPEHAREDLGRVQKGVELARSIGSPTCYFLTGRAPPRMPTDEAVDAFIAAMSSLAPQLRSCGVRLALEHNATATRENGFVHTLADAIEVACAAGIGVCVELQNCWTERHLAETFRRGMPHFTLVQVSDFVLGTPTRLTRAVPGDGDMPLEWMLANLLECGYEGDFDIELVGPHIEREGYAAAVGRSIGWLSERLHRWGL